MRQLMVLCLAVLCLAPAACDSRSLSPRDAGATAGAGGATTGAGGVTPGTGGAIGGDGGAGGAAVDAGGSRLCGGDASCAANEFCALSCAPINPGDRIAGVCTEIPSACNKLYMPVCGCDFKTYANDCLRLQARVALQYMGSCEAPPPPPCGGLVGVTCAKSQFCEYPAGTCAVLDQPGTCTPLPTACDLIYAPVCGCDGKNYPNDCERQMAGVSKRVDGCCLAGPP